MGIEVRLPQLADAMSAARLSVWLKREGDAVVAGEPLVEFETDKTNVEIEAPASGVLQTIHIAAGTDGVPVGAVLAVIADGVAAALPRATPAPRLVVDQPAADQSPAPAPALTAAPAARWPTREPASAPPVRATPLAAKMAKLAGLDLASVRPTGTEGRITKADVDAALGNHRPRPVADLRIARPRESPPAPAGLSFTDLPLSAMRRTTAARLVEAKQTIPHFYLQADCRVDGLMKLRSEVNERRTGLSISVTDLIVFAAAHALKKVPQANSSWIETGVRVFDDVDIAIAVNTERGLITPIVRAAHTKPLATLSLELKDLTKRARAGELKPDEYTGGTFTISNLGMYGVTSILPIINPPHACILGVGGIERRPVVVGDTVAVGGVMSCTLAADHRAIDGATGAELLAELRRLLEDPVALTWRV